MKKRISIILIIIAVAVGVGLGVFFGTRGEKRIDAEERISMEMDYMQNLTNFIDQVDNVTAAYSSAQIDKEAYKERNEVLKNEFFIIKNEFSIWLDQNPIKTGSETYVTKRGEQALLNMQDDVEKLLDCTFNNGEPYDIYQLYYRYMLQKDKVKADSIEYLVAYKWLQNKEGDYEDLVQEYQKRIQEESKGEIQNAEEDS